MQGVFLRARAGLDDAAPKPVEAEKAPVLLKFKKASIEEYISSHCGSAAMADESKLGPECWDSDDVDPID